MNARPCVIMVSLAVILPFCTAATYYVTTNGSDLTGDGSDTNPWLTVANAIYYAQSNDVINVGTGEFLEALAITTAVTIVGQDTYLPGNPPLYRHQSRTVFRPSDSNYDRVITAFTNSIRLLNLTVAGDHLTNGAADTRCGIYSTYRPFTVSNCLIANFMEKGIEVLATNTPSDPMDDDSLRSYFGYNTVSNITGTNASCGIMIYRAPATCISNVISNIGGPETLGGIYVRHCYYTSNMLDMMSIADNFFDSCWMAVWANDFGTVGEPVRITGNQVVNGLAGIRVSSARGQAVITSNTIHVSGVSTTAFATPARGIWIEADFNPWAANYKTDHVIAHNIISGSSISNDETAGLFLNYESNYGTNNNGVRAIVTGNIVTGFQFGAVLRSGSNGVTQPASQLVSVAFHYNDFFNNLDYNLYSTGFSYTIDATSNWFGSYFIPSNMISTNFLSSYDLSGAYNIDTDSDGTNDFNDADDDGDMLPDAAEVGLGTQPNLPDTDSDLLTDWEEATVTLTDPLNPLSVFKILQGICFSPTNFTIVWSSATNRMYSVHRSTNLQDGFGLPITNVPGTPPTNSFTDTNDANESAFYRITVTN